MLDAELLYPFHEHIKNTEIVLKWVHHWLSVGLADWTEINLLYVGQTKQQEVRKIFKEKKIRLKKIDDKKINIKKKKNTHLQTSLEFCYRSTEKKKWITKNSTILFTNIIDLNFRIINFHWYFFTARYFLWLYSDTNP